MYSFATLPAETSSDLITLTYRNWCETASCTQCTAKKYWNSLLLRKNFQEETVPVFIAKDFAI